MLSSPTERMPSEMSTSMSVMPRGSGWAV
jgi:hypothetical protein